MKATDAQRIGRLISDLMDMHFDACTDEERSGLQEAEGYTPDDLTGFVNAGGDLTNLVLTTESGKTFRISIEEVL